MGFLALLLPLIEKYGPQLEQDIVALLHKNGYTIAQVDAIFADLKPYEGFGINPSAPVQPETPPPS